MGRTKTANKCSNICSPFRWKVWYVVGRGKWYIPHPQEGKYTYWMIRPFPLDPEFKPLFTTPNHPSYPSAHSCMSSGMSAVLEHLFPADAEEIAQLANESTESRLWGGIHYRIDLEAGTAIGENVAATVIELAP